MMSVNVSVCYEPDNCTLTENVVENGMFPKPVCDFKSTDFVIRGNVLLNQYFVIHKAKFPNQLKKRKTWIDKIYKIVFSTKSIQIKSILAKVTMVFSKDGNVHCPLRVQSIIRYYQAIVCFLPL